MNIRVVRMAVVVLAVFLCVACEPLPTAPGRTERPTAETQLIENPCPGYDTSTYQGWLEHEHCLSGHRRP